MKKLRKKFMNMKIRGKMILSHIFIALIPFFLLGFTVIFITIREEGNTVVQTTVKRVEQVQQTLDIYMEGIEKIADMLIESIDPQKLSESITKEDPYWQELKPKMKEQFQLVSATHGEIAGIFLATEHDLYVGTGMSRISRDSFMKEEWYRKAVNNPQHMQIISSITGRNIATDETYSIDHVFSVVKAIVNPSTGQAAGVLLFDIKYATISNVVQESVIGKEGFAFILDAQNKMVYSPVNEVVYRINPSWFRGTEEPVTAIIHGEKYQISCRKSEYTGWKVVSVSSYQEVMRKAQELFLIIICVVAFTLILVLLIAVKISDTITRPIVELRNLMEETEDGTPLSWPKRAG